MGLSNDPLLPSEHGEKTTDTDIENLSKHVSGFGILEIPGLLKDHKFYSKIKKENKSTVLFIPGGIGHTYALDSTQFPNGYVLPLNLFAHWPNDVNLVVADMCHDLGWSWHRESKIHLKNIDKQKHQYLLGKTFPGKWTSELIDAFYDLRTITRYVKETTESNLWLAGHCSSCDLIARFYDFVDDKTDMSGLILTNPLWLDYNWKPRDLIRYFHSSVDIPLLSVQHEQDPNTGTHPDIAKKILNESKSPLTEYIGLSGGINQGLPNFSMGYHGFRDIEDQLVSSMIDFIKKC